jgi:hypothetical protein
VFKRDLLYFFVLRPAYRFKHGSEKSHQLTRFPVALVVKPEAANPPFHIYPFDTGGAASGAFAVQADPQVPLEDYELTPSHDAAAGHIAWAFGSVQNYYDGHLRQNILDDVPEYESVTRGFIDIARMGRSGSNRHDTRASAVELALDHDVDLQGNVLLAVLPKQYVEAPAGPNLEFLEKLRSLAIDFDLYDWQPNTSPDEFEEKISELVNMRLSREGWL